MKNLLLYIAWPVIAGLVFAGVILGVMKGTSFLQPSQPAAVSQTPVVSVPAQETLPFNYTFNAAIAKASPAVVSINFEGIVSSPGENLDIPQLGGTLRNSRISNSQGSGVIISSDGYIISSYHIFESEGEISRTVTLHDGRVLDARSVAYDEVNDLQLLKVSETNLPYMSFENARPLSVGDMVLAIGNPRNLQQSISMGIISALVSTEDSYLIQTDAAINPGSSGGALVDYEGNLIGINSTIVSGSGGSEGIGFATPVEKALQLMSDYVENSTIGYLGVSTDFVSVQAFEMRIDGYRVKGVDTGSAAELAGIKPGDIITAINDVKVEISDQGDSFKRALGSINRGEKANVEVFRNSEFISLEAVFGE